MKSQVLFLTETITERVAKISYALKKRGISTAVIYRNIKFNQGFEFCFDFIKKVDNPEEAIQIANRSTSDFVHLYSSFFDAFCLKLIHDGNKKIIYDAKDFFGGAYGDWINDALPGQNHLISHSKGLIYRDLQSSFTVKKLKLQRPKHKFFFPDYCWSRDLLPTFAKPQNLELKVAIIGNYLLEEGQEGLGLLLTLKTLAEQGIYIDYYAFPHAGGNFSKFTDLSLSYPNFRILNPLDPIALSSRLREYDIGLHLNQFMHFSGLEGKTFQNIDAAHYGLSSRMFDFWGAGIPTLSSNLRFYRHFSNFFKVGAVLSGPIPQDFINYINKIGIGRYQKEIDIARVRGLNIDSNIEKLINFYRSV